MSTANMYPVLELDDAGTVRIRGSRYKVLHLAAEHYQYGWTAEELLRQHPDLRPEQVYGALAYFYEHHDEFVGQIKKTAEAADAARIPFPISRDELLRRKK